jgi:uncharacterized protein
MSGERMIEEPFFFRRDGERLFAMLHRPAADKPPSSAPGFVLSHPFGEEKLWSHRVFVSIARSLAARGHCVLRFDYAGAGDSTGMTPGTDLATHLADLRAAIAALRARRGTDGPIGLLGLRLGATFAALAAEEGACDGPLVLWDPILDGDAYFLEIGKALFESCARADLLQPTPRRHAGPALVVQIVANDKVKEREDLGALARHYNAGTVAVAVEQPFWREIKPFCGRAPNLERVTLEWLGRNHA